ncbi:helix-turn-helix domain-containing protein [Bosea sp. ANAM02]|uniref:helix-turn-helix domain-containing protein n=1 Tax=Bosea sp. ANAM02 TaxID=2020412 RepID=UPI00140F2030|nr:helix-turn-helix domain-containing protein [Bosea sp. ANAM02]BCB20276.1 hypothetical protein OCUBac02_31700 [Bosea sp. ANAM02]
MSETTPAPLPRLSYTLNEAVQVTGISQRMLYSHRDAGLVTFVKNGRSNIILADDLQAMLHKLRAQSVKGQPFGLTAPAEQTIEQTPAPVVTEPKAAEPAKPAAPAPAKADFSLFMGAGRTTSTGKAAS